MRRLPLTACRPGSMCCESRWPATREGRRWWMRRRAGRTLMIQLNNRFAGAGPHATPMMASSATLPRCGDRATASPAGAVGSRRPRGRWALIDLAAYARPHHVAHGQSRANLHGSTYSAFGQMEPDWWGTPQRWASSTSNMAIGMISSRWPDYHARASGPRASSASGVFDAVRHRPGLAGARLRGGWRGRQRGGHARAHPEQGAASTAW